VTFERDITGGIAFLNRLMGGGTHLANGIAHVVICLAASASPDGDRSDTRRI
jgi:hypothetical protein